MGLILDLTASRLCYLISREVEEIAPYRFKEGETTYKDIVEIALLTLYNELCKNLENEDKDLDLIYNPNRLMGATGYIKYKDDLTKDSKQKQKIADRERIY